MAQWVKAPVQCPESTKKLSPVSPALQQQDGRWRQELHLEGEGGGSASLRRTTQQKQDPSNRVEGKDQLLRVVHRFPTDKPWHMRAHNHTHMKIIKKKIKAEFKKWREQFQEYLPFCHSLSPDGCRVLTQVVADSCPSSWLCSCVNRIQAWNLSASHPLASGICSWNLSPGE